MKKVEDFKIEFNSIKIEIEALLITLKLSNFTVDEILNFDSITFKDISINLEADEKTLAKQDYLILANESYDIIEEIIQENSISSNKTTKKTRTTLFSLKKSKILKMDDEELFKILFNYTKLIAFYERYKLLRKELNNLIILEFSEVETLYKLIPIFGFDYVNKKINQISRKSFWEYFEFQNQLKKEENLIYQKRSAYLEEKLRK